MWATAAFVIKTVSVMLTTQRSRFSRVPCCSFSFVLWPAGVTGWKGGAKGGRKVSALHPTSLRCSLFLPQMWLAGMKVPPEIGSLKRCYNIFVVTAAKCFQVQRQDHSLRPQLCHCKSVERAEVLVLLFVVVDVRTLWQAIAIRSRVKEGNHWVGGQQRRWLVGRWLEFY